MKVCRVCSRELPTSSFYKRSSSKDGLQKECKECKSSYQSTWYSLNKDSQLRRVSANKHKYRSDLRELKDNKPCTDCGVSFPYFVLEWDHLPENEKLSDVSRLSRSGSKKQAIIEIEKCELVCANCHRYRTHSRLTDRKH